MTPVTLLIVTAPGRTVDQVRSEARDAQRAGADLLEVRVDRWTPTERARLPALFPSPIPLVATLRSRSEGGEGPDDPDDRRASLAALRDLPFAYLDVELARDPPEDPTRTIGSRHLPSSSPVEEVRAAITAPLGRCAALKVVVPASVARYLTEFRPHLSDWVRTDRAFATTGPSGPLARLAGRQLGAPFVFASLPLDPAGPAPVERSQVPVDQLRRAWSTEAPRWFAVVGAPVAHSLSPQIHAGWLAADHRGAAYVPLELSTETEFDRMLEAARNGPWAGWSVTSPWKSRAAISADARTSAVERSGAASALKFEEGRVLAEQTDGTAVRRRVRELATARGVVRPEVVVVGTGGAARAAVDALGSEARPLYVLGRRREAVLAVTSDVGGDAANPERPRPVDIVVHATTVGRAGAGPLEPPIDGWLGPDSIVLDFVYAPESTGLRDLCRSKQVAYEDGRRLLVYQAAAAYEWWWGSPPSEAEVRAALAGVGCAA